MSKIHGHVVVIHEKIEWIFVARIHCDLQVPHVEATYMYHFFFFWWVAFLTISNVVEVISTIVTCLQGLSIILNQPKVQLEGLI